MATSASAMPSSTTPQVKLNLGGTTVAPNEKQNMGNVLGIARACSKSTIYIYIIYMYISIYIYTHN